MTEEAGKRIIRDGHHRTVAVMEVKDGLLDGKCEWYDSRGALVAFGFFRKGKPYAGTFINWTRFLPSKQGTQPYELEYYCADWVTLFESSFDSESPQYANVLEAYSNGSQIEIPAGTRSG